MSFITTHRAIIELDNINYCKTKQDCFDCDLCIKCKRDEEALLAIIEGK